MVNTPTRRNKIMPADIILVNSGTSYGTLVLLTLRFLQKDDVKLSHVLMAVDEDTAIVAETKVRYRNIQDYLKKVKEYKIIRNNKLTDKQRASIVKRAEALLNLRYGAFRIFLQLLDQLFQTKKFTGWLKDKKIQICSTLVSWSYYVSTKVKFLGLDWQCVEPDDIDDESIENHRDWDVVDASLSTWRL